MVDRGTFSDMNNDLSFVDHKVLSFVPGTRPRVLPRDFYPNNWTVICGRGKLSYNHFGNKRFRILCELHEAAYIEANTKTAKSLIVMNIVDTIRESSCCGGFVKQDPFTKEWFEVSEAVAREKVGQQIRENMNRKKSGSRAAMRKRKSCSSADDFSYQSDDQSSKSDLSVRRQSVESCSTESSELAVYSKEARDTSRQTSINSPDHKQQPRQISPVSVANMVDSDWSQKLSDLPPPQLEVEL